MAVALSANYLAVLRPPSTLRRLYVARDNDPAGQRAAQELSRRAQATGIEALKAAPFRRNDQMLAVLPIGVIVFPGSGISANLADKANKLGIPVWAFREGGA
jgi:hypothetical protein